MPHYSGPALGILVWVGIGLLVYIASAKSPSTAPHPCT